MKKQVIYALFAVNLLAVIFVALWTYGWIGDYEKEEITSRGTPPQVVDIGSGPNTGTGDPLRTAFNKININFSAVYDSLEKWTDLVNAGVDEQAVTEIVEGVLDDAIQDAVIGVAVEDVLGGTTGRDRYMSPTQIENYVAEHGGSFGGGERIKFTVGGAGAPAADDSTFIHTALADKQIDLFRDGVKSEYTYSGDTITVTPDWQTAENVELWLWPANTWEYLSLAPSLLDGLVAYFKLDETTGATGIDEVGNQDANVYGDDPWVTGKINNGVNINTTNRMVRLPFNDDVNPKSPEFSVSMWVYFDQLPSAADKDAYLFNMLDTGTEANLICANVAKSGTQTNRVQFYIRNNAESASVMIRSTTAFSSEQWYHVVCVSPLEGEMKIYINGEDDTNAEDHKLFEDTFEQPNSYINFGNRILNSSEYVRGQIDELMIYHRALSAGDVESLWDDGNGRQLIIP